ncbi:MAG: YbaB/EbfC family nucleoid-associated protein [Alphaproteobacteria bacterium]|nr:YbaB/EbfC family nucleoid-associated protein [Alphaproteobacteria bacterium]
MDQFDFGNFGALLGGFQQKMADMQAKQKALRVTGTAGGGLVTVVATGDFEIESVSISEEAYQDRELLEDLVRAATSEALRQVRESMKAGMQEMTGGLPIPPGLLGF